MMWFLVLVFGPFLCGAQVATIFPDVFVTIPHGNASLLCSSFTPTLTGAITGVQWLVNNTMIEDIIDINITTKFSNSVGIGRLNLTNISVAYNETSITCIAQSAAGQEEVTASVLIQGHLSAVSSLDITASNSTLSLTWKPPFTLDITGVDPDITYCVDVINSTSSVTLHSESVNNSTVFTYPKPSDTDCVVYSFCVTPHNIVGAGEMATEVYSGDIESPRVVCFSSSSSKRANGVNFDFVIVMSAPTCTSILTFVNVDSGETTVISADVMPSSDNITFDPAQLDTNSNYNVSVLASNVAGSAVSYTNISTHDIEEATIMLDNNTVGVSIEYHAGSTAKGALLNFMFETDNGVIDFDKSIILPVILNVTQDILPIQLFPGEYRVFFHDIEQSGTLSSGFGYPAVSQRLAITTASGHQPTPSEELLHLERCIFSTHFFIISVECSSSIHTISFQMIVLQSNLNQGYVLYANQSSDGHSSASVEVMDTGMYQVSVLPIVEGVGITDSSVEHSEIVMVFESKSTATTAFTDNPDSISDITAVIGAVCGFLVAAVAMLLISVLVLRLIKRRRKSHTLQHTISDQGRRQDHQAENSNLYEERAMEIELPIRRSTESVDNTEGSAQSREQDSDEMIRRTRRGEIEQPPTPTHYEIVTAVEEVIHDESASTDGVEVQYALPTKRGEVPVSDLYSTVSKPKPPVASRDKEGQEEMQPPLPPPYVEDTLETEEAHDEPVQHKESVEVQYALPTKRGEVPVSELYSTVSKPKPPVTSHDNEDQEENQPPLPPPYVEDALETEEAHDEPVQQKENNAGVEVQYALPTKRGEVPVSELYSTVSKPKPPVTSYDKEGQEEMQPPLPPPYVEDALEMEEAHGEPLQQEENVEVQYVLPTKRSEVAVADEQYSTVSKPKAHGEPVQHKEKAEVQYAPLSLPAKQSDVGLIEDHLLYTEVAGFKKPTEKGVYVFVQPVSTGMPAGDHEVSRCIHNEIIYSDVIPQDSSTTKECNKRKRTVPPKIPEKPKFKKSSPGCDDKENLPPPPIPPKKSRSLPGADSVEQNVHSLAGQTCGVVSGRSGRN